MSGRFALRQASIDDLAIIADNVAAGFETYRAWAPASWSPPGRLELLAGLLQRRAGDRSWSVLAFDGRNPVGHATGRPERDGDDRPIDGVARLTQLFVRERYWGSGAADELHDGIVEIMTRLEFSSARLWTPAGQTRARGFYARRGWEPTGAVDPTSKLGLELVEYELAPLTRPPGRRPHAPPGPAPE